MGKAIKSIAKPVGSLFGLGPEYGESFNPERSAVDQYRAFAGKTPDEIKGVEGSRIAAKEIQQNPLFASLYGEGGLQSQLGAEGQRLASQGYQLTPEDREAYGQAAGGIGRLFGQQEQAANASLARRGLASAGSGAAGATFSGLQGNKNEMLARAQTDIANRRMENTMQRLNQNRAMQAQLGSQANTAMGDQFGRQLQGRQQQGNELATAAGNERGLNTQLLQGLEDKRGAKTKNIGDAWSEGTYSGTRSGTADATASWAKMGSAPSGGGGGGMMSMFSDENKKENVRDGAPEVRQFLDSVQPHTYEYDEETKGSLFGGNGEYTSPMAQELEQSPLGAEMVEDTPDGKVVDYSKGFGTIVAAQADLNNRLKRLEGLF